MESSYVMVPVPEHLVLKTMEFILGEQGESADEADVVAPSGDDGEAGATVAPDFDHDHVARESGAKYADMPPELVERAYLDSKADGSHRELFDFLAQHPDERLKYGDVADSLGWSKHGLPGVLGTYMRRAERRYGQLRPFHIYKDTTGTWWIWMDSQQAKIIRQLG